MANKKFSEFELKTTTSDVSHIVGYNGTDNVQITPANFVTTGGTGVFLPLAGGNMTGNTTHNDNVKAIFGAGSDLEIFHSGTDSFIKDVGTGNLKIRATNLNLQSEVGADYVNCVSGGAVELYHNNAKKFETTSTGVSVTGNIGTSGSVFFDDNQGINFGNSNAKINGSSSDGIKFFGTGSEKMRLTQGGDLGLGTSFPSGKIEVVQTGSGTDNTIITQDNARKIFIGRDSIKATDLSNNATILNIQQNGGNATFGGDVDLTANSAIFLDNENNNNPVYLRNSGGNLATLQIGRGNSPGSNVTMVIDNSGNLGVGISNPVGKIHAKTSSLNGASEYQGQNFGLIVETDGQSAQFDEGNGIVFTQDYDAGNTTQIRTGAVIGYKAALANSFGGGLKFKVQQFGALPLLTAMTLDMTGNLGVGTSTPSAKIQISGTNANNKIVSYFDGNFVSGFKFSDLNGGIWYDAGADDLYLSAAQANSQMIFEVAGSERMRLDSSGNLGVGLSAPVSALHVQKDQGATNAIMRLRGQNTTARQTKIQFEDYSGALADAFISFVIPTAGSATEAYLGLGVNNATTLVVHNNDNVGIGVVAPTAKLEVYSAASFKVDVATGNPLISVLNNTATSSAVGTATIQFIQANTQAGGKIISGRDGDYSSGGTRASNLQFHTSTNASDTEKMRIHSSGNVGIGNTSNINKLDVSGNINVQGGDGGYLTFNNGDANITILTNGTGRDLTFKTYNPDAGNNAERMRIDKNGNVGIGVTAPSTKLEVAGHVTINSPGGASQTSYGLRLRKTNSSSVVQPGGEILASPYPTNTNAANLIFKTADASANLTQRMLIDGSGNLGIGLTNPGRILDVKASGGDQGIGLVQSGTDIRIFQAIQTGTGDGAVLLTKADGSDGSLIRGQGDSSLNGGDLKLGTASAGLVLKSANGTQYKITVADNGTVTSTAV